MMESQVTEEGDHPESDQDSTASHLPAPPSFILALTKCPGSLTLLL